MQIKKLLYLGSQIVKKKKKNIKLITHLRYFQGGFQTKRRIQGSGGKGKVILFCIERNCVCLKPRECSQQKNFPNIISGFHLVSTNMLNEFMTFLQVKIKNYLSHCVCLSILPFKLCSILRYYSRLSISLKMGPQVYFKKCF